MNLNNKKKNIILSKSDFIKQKTLKKKAEISKKMSAVNDVSEEKITNLRYGKFAGQSLEKQGNNIAFGTNALQYCKTGINNIAFGANSLQNVTSSSNIGFGTNTGKTLKTGFNNIIIGKNADVSNSKSMNQIVLGEGAKGHGAHRLTFGGTKIEGTDKNALIRIEPGSNNFTSLGNENYAFKSVFVSDLYCDKKLSLTLPTESGSRYNFVKTNSDGDLSFSNINRVSGLIVESEGKSKTIDTTNTSGVALITADDFVNGDGRLILDSNTVSIAINSTAEKFIKKLGLTKDLDFVQNSFIKTEGASLDLSIDGNLVDASSENSDENIKFNLHGGDNEITNEFNMIFRITRLSSNSIEMFFKKI